MRMHYLQHVPFEGPAAIANWARNQGHALTGTRLDRGESLPGLADFDWLIVMGGPMGLADVGEYPGWQPSCSSSGRRWMRAGACWGSAWGRR